VFPELDARSWLTGRPEAALYDLSPAALADEAATEPAERPAALDGADEPPAGVSVETLLATEYGVHPEQVVLTAGADAARFVAFGAAFELSDGDSGALIESPASEGLVRPPEVLGAETRRFERPTPEYGVELDGADAAGAALLALSNRHDPSGRLLTREALAEVADAAAQNGARLLVDETVAPLSETGDSLGGVTAAGLDGAVAVGSTERLPGLAGLEVGWLIGDREFVGAARRVNGYVGGVAGPSRAYALRALYGAEGRTERAREICRENSAALAATLADRPGVECRVFADAPVALLSAEDLGGRALANAAWEQGVLVAPGEFYGVPGAVRVGLGRSPERVRAGLERLSGVLDDRPGGPAGTNP
jgi:aspartate/methionine/tyrosine aminotransferase